MFSVGQFHFELDITLISHTSKRGLVGILFPRQCVIFLSKVLCIGCPGMNTVFLVEIVIEISQVWSFIVVYIKKIMVHGYNGA